MRNGWNADDIWAGCVSKVSRRLLGWVMIHHLRLTWRIR
jgi:hypothetical protein